MERFGRYVLFEKIGVGGMAEVYRAASVGEAGFVRTVAVKRILPTMATTDNYVKMLIDEASIAAQLHHNNIIQVLDLGTEAGLYFMAMEYVVGRNLGAVARRVLNEHERFPLAAVLYVVEQALRGLAYAHTATDATGQPLNIIHRDVSPQNILLGYDGAVKLSDFGIAKSDTRQTETVAGTVKGKPAYMAPEQLNAGLTTRSADVYAMGVVLHELLSGRRMRTGSTDLEVISRAMKGAVPTFDSLGIDVPTPLAQVVYTALEFEPANRWPTADSFAEAVHAVQQQLGMPYNGSQLSLLMGSLFPQEIAAEREMASRMAQELRQLRGVSSGSFQQVSQHTPRTPLPTGEVLLQAGIPAQPSTPSTSATLSIPVDLGDASVRATPPGLPGAVLTPGQGTLVAPPATGKRGALAAVAAVLVVGAAAAFLVLKPRAGGLSLTSEPAGAAVFLDGRDTGKTTPAVLKELDPGHHEVEFRSPDHTPLKLAVEVVAGETNPGRAVLTPAEVTLQITSEPGDANVEIDGALAGRTPHALVGPIGRRVKVRVVKDGYAPQATELLLGRANTGWAVKLVTAGGAPAGLPTPSPAAAPARKAPPAAGKAVISIQSNPWARVVLDGKDTGRFTPLLDFEIAAGTHKVRLVNDDEGARDEFTFSVKAGERPAPYVRVLK
ncbi:MAG: serine/threonine protein kinase [Deltaproteobacteria bacterium]|nr:serine/threonine protein kinase [Deltaproteobacteria bacterium]